LRIDEVPQDKGMIGDYGAEVCYAVDEEGRYTRSSSIGWEPKNIVNDQAWAVIGAEVEKVRRLVAIGRLSPIAFYRARHQMDLGLLACYVNMPRWRVWLHCRPFFFKRLSPATLARYTTIFGLTAAELQQVPAPLSIEQIQQR